MSGVIRPAVLVSAVLLGAHLVVSAPRIWSAFALCSFESSDAFQSTDFYLAGMTGTSHASDRILRALAALPSEKAVLLLVPNSGTQSAFVAQHLSYLGWPREVHWFGTGDEEVESRLAEVGPSTLAGVVFWHVQMPARLPHGFRFGAEQSIVPISGFEISPP